MAQIFLDTNVISEISRKLPAPGVIAFFERESDLWLSCFVLHELVHGFERLPEGDRKRQLADRTQAVAFEFAGRIAPADECVAEISGRLRGQAARLGRVLHPIDAIMAATALARDAILATRNTRDFDGLGVKLINPWEASP